jgi:hypothetical protein
MKNNILRIAIIAIGIAITSSLVFIACEKDKGTSNKNLAQITQANAEIDLSGIDFSKIKQQNGMLQFDSWQQYVDVIEELQSACVEYTQQYIENLIIKNEGKEDENWINDQIEEAGFDQFAPVYAFCNQLIFSSLYLKLATDEKEWQDNPNSTIEENPFNAMEIGRYQSALHNEEGLVMIADTVYSFNDDEGIEANSAKLTNTCRTAVISGEKFFTYDGKSRSLHGHLYTNTVAIRAFTDTHYKKGNKWRAWFTKVYVETSGRKYHICEDWIGTNYFSFPPKHVRLLWGCYVEAWRVPSTLPLYRNPSYYTIKSIHLAEKANQSIVLFL